MGSAIKDILKEIQAVELEVANSYKDAHRNLRELDKTYHDKQEALYKRRQELIQGKAPTADELEVDEKAPSAASSSVPHFWSNVLCNQDFLSELITRRDRLALDYLTSVTVKGLGSSSGSKSRAQPVVEFHFKSNPYFSNSVLRRGLPLDADEEEEAETAEVATEIKWKERHDLTMKEVKSKKAGGGGGGGGGGKKGKKGAKGQKQDEEEAGAAGGAGPKLKPCASFFRFFTHSSSAQRQKQQQQQQRMLTQAQKEAASLLEKLQKQAEALQDEADEEAAAAEQDERVAAKLAQDRQVMEVLLEQVLPRAVHLFISGPLQSPEGSSDDGEGADEDFAMVTGRGGSIEDLPAGAQVAVKALQHNQALLDEQRELWQRGKLKAARQLHQNLQQLFAKRSTLLVSPDGKSSRIPCYWLHVLRGTDTGALAITRRDAAVLAHLADVRYNIQVPERPGAAAQPQEVTAKLELEFLPGNPYLASSGSSSVVLTKAYTLEQLEGASRAAAAAEGDYPYAMRSSRVLSGPSWASAEQDPTHRSVPGEQQQGKGGKTSKGKMACSFFHLFRQHGGKLVFNLTGDDRHAQEEANDLELEFLGQLELGVVPSSAAYYKQAVESGVVVDCWGDPSAFDAESEDEVSSEEEAEEGEAAAAARAARKAKEAKQSMFKLNKGTMLVGLMLMVMMGELVVFFLDLGLLGK